jgi:ABC-type transport system involved in multi-copper enzyme maturation permease subunit
VTGLDATRIRAVVRKELRDYRRNRFVVATMAVMPLIFLAVPMVDIFLIKATASSAALNKRLALSLLYMLLIPVLVPATLAAYSVVGEREQGTLEPLLTTPIRGEEFILAKAAAALIPSVAIAYGVFGIFLAAIRLFANSVVASAIFHQGPQLVAQLLFTPLLAGWAIWVGLAVSARSKDVRVAQQLAVLGSLPLAAVTALMSFGVIKPTFTAAVVFAAALLVVNVLAWRVVSAMFDRERLVTGAKAVPNTPDEHSARSAGGPVEAPTRFTEPSSTVPSTTLKVTRKGGGVVYRNRPFQISIDGKGVGSIPSRHTVELPIAPGHHTLQMGSGRHISPRRSFDTADGGVVSFWCRGQILWPIYVASLLKPDLWITLRRE